MPVKLFLELDVVGWALIMSLDFGLEFILDGLF